MTTTSSTRLQPAHPTQPAPHRSGAAWSAVVGFDGSEPSRAALRAAAELVRARNGHLEVVYVAHAPAAVAMSASAVLGVRAGFDVIEHELADTVRAELKDPHPRWHFERRDGSVAAELIAAARQIRRANGPDSIVVIVVGSAEQRRHRFIGSNAAMLTHEHEFPLLVVPSNTLPSPRLPQAEDIAVERRSAPAAPEHEVVVQRTSAERILARVGLTRDDIAEVLGPVTFPASLAEVELRGQEFGISRGSLMERLGGSP